MSETFMPQRAAGVTRQFMIDGVPGRLMTAAAASGALTHVDLRMGKHGSTLAGLTDALSTAITTGLRGGTPTAVFVDELRHTRYVPAGPTSDPDLPHATSLGDYLAQHLRLNHPQPVERP
ncbi:TSCPD domain-containing protein [Micromonospora fulviviridis]|uniref:ribonucleoside-diphosphate reductase n=1 Tax=Micromonospora fulviviridis TaxID=47860 RepID=A0ABV2VUM7_9ACTN